MSNAFDRFSFRSEDDDVDETEYTEHDAELPDTLQSFLSNVGVLAPRTALNNSSSSGLEEMTIPVTTHTSDASNRNGNTNSSEDLIFESSFDLTEERLRHVFKMFDTDQDGNISYEGLQRGLELHTAGSSSFLDETGFQQLCNYLDVDQSGDITYGEFKDGIRLLMLRRLVLVSSQQDQLSSWTTSMEGGANVQIMDYNANRLERHVLKSGSSTRASTNTTKATSQKELLSTTTSVGTIHDMNVEAFYFQHRPNWVKTRWINVCRGTSSDNRTGTAASTLKRLAIKYLLHPLALEDALSPESHRPKAEVYSNHYFIMVPVFTVEPPPRRIVERNHSVSMRRGTVFVCFMMQTCLRSFRHLLCGNNARRQQDDDEEAIHSDSNKFGTIRIQMTSIFVNVPKNDTIITYNDDDNHGYNSKDNKFQNSSLLNPSEDCWVRVQQELGKSYSKLRQYDAQYLTYALLDRAVDLIEPIIKQIRRELRQEKQLLRENDFTDQQGLDRVHHLREELEKMARKLKPFMRLLVHVIEDDAISPGATVYLRDVLDNLEYHDEEAKDLISECQAIDADAENFQSRKMEQTLYTLTVISAIFLPAQFLTGVWGMNFEHMPELDEKWGYAMFWGIAVFMSMTLLFMLDFGRFRF